MPHDHRAPSDGHNRRGRTKDNDGRRAPSAFPQQGPRPDEPPSVLRARRLAAIELHPVLWDTTGYAGRTDAYGGRLLAVIGYLWLGELMGRTVVWSGSMVRGDLDAPALLATSRAWRGGKGGVGIVLPGRRPVQIALLRGGGDFWAGRVDLDMIWNSCARSIDPTQGAEQENREASATGYDADAVARSIDIGFAPATHGVAIPAKPVAEMLMALGAEWLMRRGGWRLDVAGGRQVLWLPLMSQVAVTDIGELEAALKRRRFDPWSTDHPAWGRYPIGRAGYRRYLLPLEYMARREDLERARAQWMHDADAKARRNQMDRIARRRPVTATGTDPADGCEVTP